MMHSLVTILEWQAEDREAICNPGALVASTMDDAEYVVEGRCILDDRKRSAETVWIWFSLN